MFAQLLKLQPGQCQSASSQLAAVHLGALLTHRSPPHTVCLPSADAEEQCQALPQPPRLLEVPKEAFSRLLLLPDMLSDHLPDSYLAVLQRL